MERATDGGLRGIKSATQEESLAAAVVPAAVIGQSALKRLLEAKKHEGEWAMSLCAACEDYSTWRSDSLVYPRSSSLPLPSEDMPEDAAVLYQEAREVVAVSRRAGAALARATLERLLKNLDPEAGDVSLAGRIGRILPNVSTPLGQMLTVIRHVGNKSLHVEDEPDDAVVLILDEAQTEIIGLIFESINALVDERITRPAAAKRILSLVPEDVLKNVKGLNPPAEL